MNEADLLVQYATELAHGRTILEIEVNNADFSKSTIATYKDQLADILEYTPKVQKIFDKYYDFYYEELLIFKEKLKKIICRKKNKKD